MRGDVFSTLEVKVNPHLPANPKGLGLGLIALRVYRVYRVDRV